MSEKKQKKTYIYVPPVVENFNNEDFATSNVSLNAENVEGTDVAGEAYDGMKFTVVCPREKVENHETLESLEEALHERWNIGLQGVLDVFYSAAFTRPDYKGAAKEEIEAQDWAGAHLKAQSAIDDYQFNVRKAPAARVTKAEAQELKSLKALAQEKGLSLEQLIEMAKNL